jgi:hypothetical protein
MKREDVADKHKVDFPRLARELTADDYVTRFAGWQRRGSSPRRFPRCPTTSLASEYGDKIVETDKAIRKLAPTDRDLPGCSTFAAFVRRRRGARQTHA